MNCLKCGREINAEQTFCDNCLAGMSEYPIKPGTKVHLPRRPNHSAQKKTVRRRPVLTEQEQILRLKRRIGRLHALAALLALILAAMLFWGYQHLRDDRRPQPGQNYSAVIKETEEQDVSRETIPNP